ncbi:MAG TPA: cache domain-containing protein [Candidatus Baltobacteraceae bacterium]|nr:cache domain-containing protein [Candidatus Baltobacteraceae bacterium]
MSLRVRLLGTIVATIVFFFLVSVIASRVVLQRDLTALGKTQVTNGSGAFQGYWDSRKDQIRLLVAQDAVSDTLRKSVQSHNVGSLTDQLANAARTSGLSFLTVTDVNGNVIARANGAQPGSLKNDPLVQRALTGETVSTATILGPSVLAGEGLAPQAQASIRSSDGKGTAEQIDKGLAIIAAAPISDENERTIGVVYGGVLLNHFYDLVDQTTAALGGASAILEGDAIISSTIQEPDGTRTVDQQVAPAANVVASGQPYVGVDTEGGTQYLVRIDPIVDDQQHVLGARWYGTPLANLTGIINHTTTTLILWGVIAMIIAIIFGVLVVQVLSNTLDQRSKQVRRAAKELGVVIVGSEVSGDHVAMTKAAVERAGALIDEMAAEGNPSPKLGELKAVNQEIESDVTVIDTLSQEMSSRMQQAANRVSELNEVAAALTQLVTGEAG